MCKPNVNSAANHCCQLGRMLISKLLATPVKCLKYIKIVAENKNVCWYPEDTATHSGSTRRSAGVANTNGVNHKSRSSTGSMWTLFQQRWLNLTKWKSQNSNVWRPVTMVAQCYCDLDFWVEEKRKLISTRTRWVMTCALHPSLCEGFSFAAVYLPPLQHTFFLLLCMINWEGGI